MTLDQCVNHISNESVCKVQCMYKFYQLQITNNSLSNGKKITHEGQGLRVKCFKKSVGEENDHAKFII